MDDPRWMLYLHLPPGMDTATAKEHAVALYQLLKTWRYTNEPAFNLLIAKDAHNEDWKIMRLAYLPYLELGSGQEEGEAELVEEFEEEDDDGELPEAPPPTPE